MVKLWKPVGLLSFVLLTCLLADATGRVLAGCHRVRAVRHVAAVHHGHHVAAFNAHHYPVYYNVGSALREQAIAEKAVEIALEKIAAKLAGGYAGQQQAGGNCNTCNTGGSVGNSNPPPQPGASDAQAQAIFNASCVRCHTGAAAKGGVDLTNVAGLSEAVRGRSAMLAYIGEMPPEGQGEPIDQAEADFLLRWAAGR